MARREQMQRKGNRLDGRQQVSLATEYAGMESA